MIRMEQKRRPKPKAKSSRDFDYSLNYKKIDFKKSPDLYRVGKGEQGVLLVEPYKSEILKYWKFKTPIEAKKSALAITKLFKDYKKHEDFIGMDMSRKFLQMGYTRARRYANHKSGQKYDKNGKVLKYETDEIKAQSAEIFYQYWRKAEADKKYAAMKQDWKLNYG